MLSIKEKPQQSQFIKSVLNSTDMSKTIRIVLQYNSHPHHFPVHLKNPEQVGSGWVGDGAREYMEDNWNQGEFGGDVET